MEDDVVNILDILNILKSKCRIIVSITLAAAIISVIYSFFIITPIYSSNVKVFIGKGESLKSEYNSSDLDLYKNLTKTYTQIITTDDLLQKAVDNNNLNVSVNDIKSGLSINEGDDTQIMTIQYNSTSNQESKEVLDAVVNQFIIESRDLIPNGKAKVIQNSKFPKGPVNNNSIKNISIGVLIGIIFGSGFVILIEYLKNTLKSKEEIERAVSIPVIGVIPTERL